MSDYLDHLPGQQRENIRKRLRSPEAYEAMREKVKGPEDLEREMQKSEQLAEVHMALETEPRLRDDMKSAIEQDIAESGIEKILETKHLSPEAKAMIEQGRFTISVDAHSENQTDALVLVPEGNVNEKVPVQQVFSEKYTGQLMQTTGKQTGYA